MQPNRTGGRDDVGVELRFPVSAARTGIDSIQGNANETPAPRRKCLRETAFVRPAFFRFLDTFNASSGTVCS